MAKKSKSFKKYGRKEDESADDFLDRVMGNTKKERERDFYNTLKELGMLDDIVKAKQLDDEARRRRTQLGNKSIRRKKYRPNQMDTRDPTGIDVKKGGLILRVTNRGPLYKGKKSGNKIS